MASFTPTDEQFDKMKREEIIEFLRSRGKRRSGLKAELLAYAKAVAKETLEENIIADSNVLEEILEKRKIFEDDTMQWSSFQSLKSSDIPKAFTMSVITNFLTKLHIQLDEDEVIDTEIDRHADKGRQMYFSRRIQMVETCSKDNFILFRANIEASMTSNLFR